MSDDVLKWATRMRDLGFELIARDNGQVYFWPGGKLLNERLTPDDREFLKSHRVELLALVEGGRHHGSRRITWSANCLASPRQ